MDSIKENIHVNSNWCRSVDESAGRSFIDLLKTEYIKGSNDADISDLVNLSKFLVLEQSIGINENCIIQVKLPKKITMQKLVIVCDAPKIEIYCGAANNDEAIQNTHYFKTVFGGIVSEFSELDTKIFRYDIDCDDIDVLELKFHNDAQSLLLIGLTIYYKHSENADSSGPINIRHVEKILGDCNLSDEASKVLNFLKENSQKKTNSIDTLQQIKNYFDKRLDEIEKNLSNKFAEQLRMIEDRQQQKLDIIIGLLTEHNNR